MSIHSDTLDQTGRIAWYATWPLALWNVYIFVWYLQYKFTGNPGSIELFTTLTDWLGFHGYEAAMRIGTGSAELLASILLVIPPSRVFGALLSFCIMAGAIFFHLVSPLGVDPYGDGGVLFKQACATCLSSLIILFLLRHEVMAWIDWARARVAKPA
jgi:uncharacterized membrane protein YphA (DoxX/SURF4 family)